LKALNPEMPTVYSTARQLVNQKAVLAFPPHAHDHSDDYRGNVPTTIGDMTEYQNGPDANPLAGITNLPLVLTHVGFLLRWPEV
jgi:hypothetical protein